MKTILDYINEAKLANPEMPHDDGKNKEKVAYDTSGDGWIVRAYCYADGGAPEGCNSLKDLLKKYDTSGAMSDWIDDGNVGKNTFIVGACREDDEEELAAWVWGYDGICYENKKH